MKKYNLFKVLAITVCVAWLLTLIIPGSYLDYSGKVTTNAISGVGIWSLLSDLSISISYFNGIAVFLIAIAVLYAVLGKLDIYNAFVMKTADLFKNKKGTLVVVTTIVFGILASLVNDSLILLVFVPFIYKVMSELKVDKKVILSSTIIAGLLGAMCNIYNSTLFSSFNLEINTLLLVKAILLVISLFVLIMFIAPKNEKQSKSNTVKKEDTIKKETKVVSSKKPAAKKSSASKKSTNKSGKKGA